MKTIQAIIVTAICVLVMTGCSSSEEKTANKEVSTEVTQPSSAPAETSDPAVDGTGPAEIKGPELEYSPTQLFCGIKDSGGKVTSEDVILADNIATEMRASGDEFIVLSAQTFEILAEEFQFAIDENKSHVSPSELEIIIKSCEIASQE